MTQESRDSDTKIFGNCEVNLNDECMTPWRSEGCEPVRTNCYRCGKTACKDCSELRYDRYTQRRIRMCKDCIEDES